MIRAGHGIDTLLAVVALILATLTLAGMFTPLTALAIAVILLSLAVLFWGEYRRATIGGLHLPKTLTARSVPRSADTA